MIDTSDSSLPGFWDVRFRRATTPWDLNGVPAELAEFATSHEPCRVLIPGCGTGHDAAYLDDRGFDVDAVDFSDGAIEAARAALGERATLVRKADFFAFDVSEPYDAVYERAFLCALPASTRLAYASRMQELVAPGGVLVGSFYVAATTDGPPNGLRDGELAELLGPAFRCESDQATVAPLPVFGSGERWQCWRRVTLR